MALSTFVKEFFGRVQLVLKSSAASQIDALAETDGKIALSHYGKTSGGTSTAFLTDTGGYQALTLYGKQTGGTIGALNLNANNVLRVEIVSGGTIQVDPVLITNSESLLWNPGTTSASLYEVMFNIVNSTSSDVTGVSIGVDIGAGGSLSAGEYFVQGLIVPGNGVSGFYGPFVIDGADRIRGVAGTTNVLSLHLRVKQVY